MFNTVDKLLHRKVESRFPTAPSSETLANNFANFFCNKIVMIQNDLLNKNITDSNHHSVTESGVATVGLTEFREMSEDQVKKLLNTSGMKSCMLDPMPASMLKNCIDILLPVFTKIINLSLETGSVPKSLKQAIIKPKLKKESLNHEDYSHFRPISNLKFLSKLIEKAILYQLKDYMEQNNLEESLQSAYKRFHSTETALVKVHNDIAYAIDNKCYVILLLLDLSAAFDTVDHAILLSRLSSRFGITDNALRWFTSYLEDREQRVCIDGIPSSSKPLRCGVPQGSVLGPVLYLMYTHPLGDIVRRHGLSCHFYADDTQLYCSFKPENQTVSVSAIESCVKDIDNWMLANRLKLNRDKTELLVIGSHYRPQLGIEGINVADESIKPSDYARNIGIIFDKNITLERHVNMTCKSAFFHLRNIAKIRECLSQENAETLVHAFISSKLDFCNALLYGLPQYLIDRLQYVQNCAARMLTKTKRSQHITPVLRELHWLPVKHRITYKILLLTYKTLNFMAPKYLIDLLQRYTPPRQLRSSSKNILKVPKSISKSYGDRAFQVAAPKLWNKLPDEIKLSSSLNEFKSKLKTFLFREAYE